MLEKVQENSWEVNWEVLVMRWLWLACLLIFLLTFNSLFTLLNLTMENLSFAFLLLGGAAVYNVILMLFLCFKLFPRVLLYLNLLVDALFLIAFLYASGGGTGPLIWLVIFSVLAFGFQYDVIANLSVAVILVLTGGIFYFLEWPGTGQTGNLYSPGVGLTAVLLAAVLGSGVKVVILKRTERTLKRTLKGTEKVLSDMKKEIEKAPRDRQAALTRQAIVRRFNPYISGGPIREPDMFFGREEALGKVLDTIQNNHVAIYGERRIGKTSFLHQLDNRLREVEDPQYRFIPAFVNLQGVPAERLFYTLMSAIARSCQTRVDLPNLICAIKKEGYDAYDLVDDLETVLEAEAATTDKQIRVVLLLDEGDELNKYDPRVQARLRGIFMTEAGRYLRMVWSGLSIDKEWKLDTSPWYNLFAIEIRLSPFTREEALRLIQEPVKGIYRYDKDAIELISQYSGRKPFRIQQICLASINRVLAQKRRPVTGPMRVTKEDVERAYQGLAAEEAISREVEERDKVGLLEKQIAEGGPEYQVNTDGQGDQ